MQKSFCYWSIATGKHVEYAKNLVNTARSVGVKEDFHVITDVHVIESATTHVVDVYSTHKYMSKIDFLKSIISKLNYDYYVFLDPYSYFIKKPVDIITSCFQHDESVFIPKQIIDTKKYANQTLIQKYQHIFTNNGIEVSGIKPIDLNYWIIKKDFVGTLCHIATELFDFGKQEQTIDHSEYPLLAYVGELYQNPKESEKYKNNWLLRHEPKVEADQKRIDKNDHRTLRHSRDKYKGFSIGEYKTPPPMLFSREGHNLWEGDSLRGSSAFLILGGPSFGSLLKQEVVFNNQRIKVTDALNLPGFITMSVNNSPKSYRTNLWTSVDDPTHFIKSIWLDPKIKKYVPFDHAEKNIFDNEKWEMMETKVGDCPNIAFYRRNEFFNPDHFLTENTFNWGNHSDNGGGRSVMLVAIRMLYYLGIRRVFLLGCDFNMDEKTKYHFDQDRSKGSISGNNSSYLKLIDRFAQLKPIFDERGFEVYNCNPLSNLKVFPMITFQEAVNIATELMPKDILNERTEGLYDRKKEK